MNRHKWLFTLVLLGLAAACVTINVYFPEAAIKDLSKQIEQQVQKEAAKAETAPAPAPPAEEKKAEPKKQAAALDLLDELLGVTPVYAAEEVPAPEIQNPAIRKIIASRGARAPELAKYKAAGVIGENNKGFLEIRQLDAVTDLKGRAAVQKLVKDENADRTELYREMAAAKNVDAAQIGKIGETYAATLRENAKPGEWIQMPDGNWKKK